MGCEVPPRSVARRIISSAMMACLVGGCASAGPTTSVKIGTVAAVSDLWPCRVVPAATVKNLGLEVTPSSPPAGATRTSSAECAFYNPATTVGVVLGLGEGDPSAGSATVKVPGLGAVYVRPFSVPIDAGAVAVEVPAPIGRRDAFWSVAVTCRTGCDDAAALQVAEDVTAAVGPRAKWLFEKQPAGTRYWAPGGGEYATSGNSGVQSTVAKPSPAP